MLLLYSKRFAHLDLGMEYGFPFDLSFLCMYIYIYICMYVCVCKINEDEKRKESWSSFYIFPRRIGPATN